MKKFDFGEIDMKKLEGLMLAGVVEMLDNLSKFT